MKPRTNIAMLNLIKEARETIPLDISMAEICTGLYEICPKKLIEFLDMELVEWEQRLKKGEIPDLGDVSELAKKCKHVHEALEENGLIYK